jgi:hypothetical protein
MMESDADVLRAAAGRMVEKFNPYHDERGRFTHARGGPGVQSPAERAASKRSEDSLWQHTEDYHHAAEKAGKKGDRGPFLHYVPKDKMPEGASDRWVKLNREVGSAEGRANAMEKWLKIPAKADTEKKRKYILAMMFTERERAKQTARERDREAKKAGKAEAAEKGGSETDLVHDMLSLAEGLEAGEAEAYRKRALDTAVDTGLITQAEADEILASF